MVNLNPSAHQLLARQHGVASLSDFAACGVSTWEVSALVKQGWLEVLIPGSWRLVSSTRSEMQRCAAVCRAHPSAIIGGPTAGRLLGLRKLPRDMRVHMISPPASNPTIHPWVSPFRTATWTTDDVVERDDGIRMLARPRLALDLARFVGDDDLLSIIEQCMHDGNHDAAAMLRPAIDWVSPRRRWVRRYIEAMDRRVAGPAAESHLEVVLGDRLVAAGVDGLVRQHPIDAPGLGRIRFDLAVPALRWAIEVDGFPTHRETVGAQDDARRDRHVRRLGWTVDRVGPYAFGTRLRTTVRELVETWHRHRSAAQSAIDER